VIGAGAWGTALVMAASRTAAPPSLSLWAHEAEVVAAITALRRNEAFLPGVEIPASVQATSDLARAAADADLLLLAVPAQHVRAVSAALAAHLTPGAPLILCAKGIELESGKLMTQVLGETCPGAPLAVLSGPTFAAEVAAGKPTAVTLACADEGLGRRLAAALGSAALRPYLSHDLIGAQVGGAVKNVIAIACGIVEGRQLGDNARAALMTRGLAEMMRLGAALGGERQTLMGLSGLGDLALTCNGIQSRNMSLGIALGKGRPLAELLAATRSIAEGVPSAAAVHKLAERIDVDMPIVGAVNNILHHGADITRTIAALLERPFKTEG
jgi:glycerol-3-phosphate dehydrogenase (NAD(P)+)